VHKSAEILALVEQSIRDQAERGIQAALDVTTREPGLVSIGTGPNEWFASFAEVEQALTSPSAASDAFPQPENREIEAYAEGTVGWGYVRSDLTLPSGVTLKIRQTFIVHLEDDGWKFVHSHVSVGIPDSQLVNIHY
jgi:hypothetical protein